MLNCGGEGEDNLEGSWFSQEGNGANAVALCELLEPWVTNPGSRVSTIPRKCMYSLLAPRRIRLCGQSTYLPWKPNYCSCQLNRFTKAFLHSLWIAGGFNTWLNHIQPEAGG